MKLIALFCLLATTLFAQPGGGPYPIPPTAGMATNVFVRGSGAVNVTTNAPGDYTVAVVLTVKSNGFTGAAQGSQMTITNSLIFTNTVYVGGAGTNAGNYFIGGSAGYSGVDGVFFFYDEAAGDYPTIPQLYEHDGDFYIRPAAGYLFITSDTISITSGKIFAMPGINFAGSANSISNVPINGVVWTNAAGNAFNIVVNAATNGFTFTPR